MNATDEAQLRSALTDAAETTGLTLDTDAVIRQGHRKVRGRQLAIAAGTAAAAMAVALTFTLGGRPTAEPVPANSTDIGSVAPGSVKGRWSGPGVDVSFELRLHGSGASATWTANGRTVTRDVPAPAIGNTYYLLPESGGVENLVLYAVYTGPMTKDTMASASLVDEPVGMNERVNQRAKAGSTQVMGSQTLVNSQGERVGLLGGDVGNGADYLGVRWDTTRFTDEGATNTNQTASDGSGQATTVPMHNQVALGSEEQANLRPGRAKNAVAATVIRRSPMYSTLLWRSGDSFGIGGLDVSDGKAMPGDLKATLIPGTADLKRNAHILGWVRGATNVDVRSTSAKDSFDISYSDPVDGWRAFAVTSQGLNIEGNVTITSGARSVTPIDYFSDAVNGPSAATAVPTG